MAGITAPVFARVSAPLVGPWTWARTLPGLVSRLGVTDVEVVVDAPLLRGGSAEAAFWAHTFRSAEARIVGTTDPHDPAATPVRQSDVEDVMALLSDPQFWTPFVAVICVSCRVR